MPVVPTALVHALVPTISRSAEGRIVLAVCVSNKSSFPLKKMQLRASFDVRAILLDSS